MAGRAAHEVGVASAEQLNRLHRSHDEPEAPAEVEVPGVGKDGLHREAVGAVAQGGKQGGIGVERDDLVSAAGEVERDAPGAGADVEHRPAGLLRERAPQRQVVDVAAAFDVVPDDAEIDGHTNDPLVTPRRVSSSRNSSIAV